MASSASELRLKPDEFAFYFSGGMGVEAAELGLFLQRAATLARRQGADLVVTDTRPGSLAVICKAIATSKVGQGVQKEFLKAPVQTTAAGTAIVGAVVGALIYAMSPDNAGATPIAKAGADVIETCKIDKIEIITVHQTVLVMDRIRASRVRELQRERSDAPRLASPVVERLVHEAAEGTLLGTIFDVAGELHFRPDGQRFLVPVELSDQKASQQVSVGKQYRLKGEILTYRGQPSAVLVHSVETS